MKTAPKSWPAVTGTFMSRGESTRLVSGMRLTKTEARLAPTTRMPLYHQVKLATELKTMIRLLAREGA